VRPVKTDEILEAVKRYLEQQDVRTTGLMLDLVALPLPRRIWGLHMERGKLEELERKAGRANSVWDYCEERIVKIDAELNKRLGRAILIVAVLTLVATFLFGFGILHPKSVMPTAPTNVTAPEGQR